MLLRLPIIAVFDNISGYRRYKIMSFDAPQQGEVTGQTARNRLRRLSCVVERSSTDISHFKLFYFPNVKGLVQWMNEWMNERTKEEMNNFGKSSDSFSEVLILSTWCIVNTTNNENRVLLHLEVA